MAHIRGVADYHIVTTVWVHLHEVCIRNLYPASDAELAGRNGELPVYLNGLGLKDVQGADERQEGRKKRASAESRVEKPDAVGDTGVLHGERDDIPR
ncbi:MAG: hypothetical protein LBR80_10590 [Deltaproteobacteria bacterium]|jgi:hypothetical protein|nr:hypothetical protein [Deltaproteobacteria bacterium]